VLIGLAMSIGFILKSNLARPLKKVVEKHVTGDILRIELSEQVSFFNRAALEHTLDSLGAGTRVVIDASNSDFIDPDVLHLIQEFKQTTAEKRSVIVSLVGFKDQYAQLDDEVLYEDFATREVQTRLTPKAVLDLLREGNERFLRGQRLHRDWSRQVSETAKGQAPLAVVLSCIDSRNSSELIFDLGIGDIFSVRIAGNVAQSKVLGSIEFSCAVAGAKLIVVMGHTRCGAVNAAVKSYGDLDSVERATGCKHIKVLLESIQKSIDPQSPIPTDAEELEQYADTVAVRHVHDTIEKLMTDSEALAKLVTEGKVGIVGGLYDVKTGRVSFFGARGPLAQELREPHDSESPLPVEAAKGDSPRIQEFAEHQ
jgi:carbonic anhydrase